MKHGLFYFFVVIAIANSSSFSSVIVVESFSIMTKKNKKVLVGCDTFVAFPPSSPSGIVVFGKNSDRPQGEAQSLCHYPANSYKNNDILQCTYIQIPQVQQTYAVLLSQIVRESVICMLFLSSEGMHPSIGKFHNLHENLLTSLTLTFTFVTLSCLSQKGLDVGC